MQNKLIAKRINAPCNSGLACMCCRQAIAQRHMLVDNQIPQELTLQAQAGREHEPLSQAASMGGASGRTCSFQ